MTALDVAATGRGNLREKMKGVEGTKSLEEEGRGREGEAEEWGWVQKDCWLVSNSREHQHQKRWGREGFLTAACTSEECTCAISGNLPDYDGPSHLEQLREGSNDQWLINLAF